MSFAIASALAREPAAAPHDTRDRVIQLVTAHPGIPLTELRSRLGVSWGTLYYHLRRLGSTGRIHIVRAGRRRLAYADLPRVEEALDIAMLRGATARRIAELIAERPRRTIADILSEVDDSPRAVYYHLHRLVRRGLVTSSSLTRHQDLTADSRLVRILKSMSAGSLGEVRSPAEHESCRREQAAGAPDRR